MKKILSLAVVLLCTICSWAQTSVSTYEELKSACATSGNVKLTADIILEHGIGLYNKEVVIDLNGHTLECTPNHNQNFDMFSIGNNSKLTIDDSSTGKSGKIMGSNNYCVMKISGASSVIFNGGSICNNGGAVEVVFLFGRSTFIMNGGSIKNNSMNLKENDNCCVFYNMENSKVYLFGGEICNNRIIYNTLKSSRFAYQDVEIGGTVVIKDNIIFDESNENPLNITAEDVFRISTTKPLADGAEIHITGTANREIPGLTADNVKYFKSDETDCDLYCKEANKLTVHAHTWATTWNQTATHHYHACTADGCGLTDYSTTSANAAYAVHSYGTDITAAAYYTCSVCSYVNTTRKADAEAATAVVTKMNAIGTVAYTDECKDKIDEARTAYDALTADQKAIITAEQYKVLTDAEAEYAKLKADAEAAAAVVTKINAIGTVEYTDECKGKIDEARTAYDALTADQKALTTAEQYKVLTDAEAEYAKLKADAEAAAAVVTKINAIGTVEYTDECKGKIDDARTAYDALTDAQKALITAEQYKVLTDAEAEYAKLKADAEAAAAVVEKTNAIGTVEYTDECKGKIDEARTAYDALTADQKALITAEQYKVLTDAEAEYQRLKIEAMKALARSVVELIDAIAPVDDSYNTAKAISDARIAYDNLIAEAKPYVTNYDDLVAAETLYNQMVSFDSYRNSRALLLGARLTQFDNAEVRREVADAAQKIQALEYVEELTLEENKKRVDDIYNTYLDILKKSRHDAVVADLLEVAKHNGKASIMLFLGISDSQRAIDAANEGIAQIDALEYDYEADLSANLDDVFDIVIDTKINIVKAWKADFDDLKAEIIEKIRNLIGIGTLPEAKVAGMFYDYSLTREENNAKLTEVMQSIGGTTGINAVNAATAKNGKYIENGKLVIVKNGKAYTAAGQMK